MIFRLPVLTPMVLALVLLSGGRALAAEPESLVKLRALFEQKARIASGLWNDYYAKALQSLETELATKGDYEQARAVKARRDELAAASASVSAPIVNAISLTAENARFSGAVSAKGGDLVGWRTSTCAAEWTLPRLAPGSYRLELSYSMSDRPPDPDSPSSLRPADPVKTAAFAFREMSLLGSAARNQRSLTLEGTAASDFKTILVEQPLELTRPPFTLRLTATASYPANVIAIRDVKLVPMPAAGAAASTAAGTPASSMAGELEKLRQAHSQQLIAARKPVVDSYLSGLATTLPAAADAEERDSILEAERRRVMRLVDSAPSKNSMSMKLDNFEEVSNAKFVPDPGNGGDRFKVEHEGRQFFVRLAWVLSPPADPVDSKGTKQCAVKFGADELQMPELGQAAKEFTALYLEGRPLQMLLRHSKKREDEVFALVFLESIGLFQGVLIDHGLAVMDTPPGGAHGGLEAGLMAGLQERENVAKKQSPGSGGWGLKTAP